MENVVSFLQDAKETQINAFNKAFLSLTNKRRENFGALLRLGKIIDKGLNWWIEFGKTETKKKFKDVKIDNASFLKLCYGIDSSYAYRLIKAGKIAPSIVDNYLNSLPAGAEGSLKDLISFDSNKPKKQVGKKRLLLSFEDKKFYIDDKGKVFSSLSLKQIEAVILELQKVKASIEAQ